MSSFNELILSNFKKEFKGYRNNLTEKGPYWHLHYDSKINESINLNQLINFRTYKERLFNGDVALPGALMPYSKKIFEAHSYKTKIKTSSLFTELLIKWGFEFVFNNLKKKNTGNCENSLKINGRFVDITDMYAIHDFGDLKEFVFSKKKIKLVCEIGGGFGSLSRIILNNYDCKLFFIDLPEANLLCSYYLHESCPEKKIYLYDNYLKEKNDFVSSDNIKNFDIFILPPWAKFNNESKIDLFINTRSMMEMEFESIKKYFHRIHRYISDDGFFLNINRYHKQFVMGKFFMNMPVKAGKVHRSINLIDYPYDNNWEVIVSKKAFKQEHVHFLLTRRKFSNFKNNIKSEIAKIEIESKKYTEGGPLANIQGVKKGYLRIFIVETIFNISKILFGKSFLNKLGKKLLSITERQ